MTDEKGPRRTMLHPPRLIAFLVTASTVALAGCGPAPPPRSYAQSLRVHKAVVANRKLPPVVPAHAADTCRSTEGIELSLEEREHLFQQFDKWRLTHGNDTGAPDVIDAPVQKPSLGAQRSLQACLVAPDPRSP